MNRDGHDNARFFTGVEVEHTPVYGKKTLFVVGLQSTEEIQAWLADSASREDQSVHIDHIYFGANMSFPNWDVNSEEWTQWENMIQHFLQLGYWCTLDVDVGCVQGLAEGVLVEYNNFIPMISVKIPYARLLNYNTTVKIDDRDFAATNPGVWTHSLHSLMTRETFTDWSQYTKDKIIK